MEEKLIQMATLIIGGSIAFIITSAIYTWAIIDIIKSEFEQEINKLAWLITVVFIPFAGITLYLFAGKGTKKEIPHIMIKHEKDFTVI